MNPPAPARTAIYLTVFWTLGCGVLSFEANDVAPSEPTVTRSGEVEPNDNITEAQPLTLGQPVSFSIHPTGDRDWFVIELQEPGYLSLQIADPPDSVTLQAQLVTYHAFETEKQQVVHDWIELPASVRMAEGGTYHLQLADDYDNAASEARAQLKVELIAEFDDCEPNDEPAQAFAADVSTPLQLAIFPKGDQDWFKVTVHGPGYLAVQETGTPETLGLRAQFATHDEWEGVHILKSWTKLPAVLPVQTPAEFHVQLADDYNNAESQTLFKVRMVFEDEIDPNEPNNEIAQATPLTTSTPIPLAIYPIGDVDWFELALPDDASIVRVMGKDVQGVKIEASLFTVANEFAEPSQVGNKTSLPAEFPIHPARTNYLQITDDYNNAASRTSLDLKVEALGADGEPLAATTDR